MSEKELQVKDKVEVDAQGEHTRSGPVFVPAVDIFEDADKLVLIADMPGVSQDNVNIHVEDNELRILGHVAQKQFGSPSFVEYTAGDFMRTFSLSNVIDQSGIEAVMNAGVLRITLPKAEAAKPRKIEVKSS